MVEYLRPSKEESKSDSEFIRFIEELFLPLAISELIRRQVALPAPRKTSTFGTILFPVESAHCSGRHSMLTDQLHETYTARNLADHAILSSTPPDQHPGFTQQFTHVTSGETKAFPCLLHRFTACIEGLQFSQLRHLAFGDFALWTANSQLA